MLPLWLSPPLPVFGNDVTGCALDDEDGLGLELGLGLGPGPHSAIELVQTPGPPGVFVDGQQIADESPHGFSVPVVQAHPMIGRAGSSQ